MDDTIVRLRTKVLRMHGLAALWKSNTIAFISSFCVMVIELSAARILAPSLGVSLYTWTTIIGVILGGIALGNFIGGKIADKYASPSLLVSLFFIGALATIAILPLAKLVPPIDWLNNLPVMFNFTIKISCIFFAPSLILSMTSPLIIKLTLANLGRTGGVVGIIYACSTAGSILGTFLTGFFFIDLLGTGMTIWMVVAVLVLTGLGVWISWWTPYRWTISIQNMMIWSSLLIVIAVAFTLLVFDESWRREYTRESNYYTIDVLTFAYHGDATTSSKVVNVLVLDHLVHSYVNPDDPTELSYSYLEIFKWLVKYYFKDKPDPAVLHLGGGGYSFPRYMEAVYPDSSNDVIEIDPAVTQIAYDELALPKETRIKTYNQDARIYLTNRSVDRKYDIVIGDVFNDLTTPYHLTTLEFIQIVKNNMSQNGIYLINIIDNYSTGRYMPAFINTLKHVFGHVYMFSHDENYKNEPRSTFVLAATDQDINLSDFYSFLSKSEQYVIRIFANGEHELDNYLRERNPILLTDDYAPTDVLIAPIFRQRAERR